MMAPAAGYALFDTAIGRCAIAWGERGITDCALPAANEETLRRLGTPGAARTKRRMLQIESAIAQGDLGFE